MAVRFNGNWLVRVRGAASATPQAAQGNCVADSDAAQYTRGLCHRHANRREARINVSRLG